MIRILYDILDFLVDSGAKSKVKAMTLKEIQEGIIKENTEDENYNERTIYNRLNELIEKGLISNGLRKGNAHTYFISKDGLEWMDDKTKQTFQEEVIKCDGKLTINEHFEKWLYDMSEIYGMPIESIFDKVKGMWLINGRIE